jgi:hypothetical protein
LPVALVRKLVKARIAENKGNSAASKGSGKSRTDPAVITFLKNLDHPLKKEIEAVRQIILGVSPEIQEGIKWNSPSFRTADWFATVNVRAKDVTDRFWLILHTGATAKGKTLRGKIADPRGLLQWLAKDRCFVTLDNSQDVRAKRAALEEIVRAWIRQL